MAIPKYQHIKDELKQQIISGKFENGDKFYTEAELIKIYDVSSITVVRALNDLAADGYIVRQQGKGTFVAFEDFIHPFGVVSWIEKRFRRFLLG